MNKFKKRLIARIDTKNNKVVKGIEFEGYSVIGDIKYFTNKYYNEGADEIILIDTIASLNNRNSLKTFILESTKNIFIPITVCGGLRTEEDINSMLRSGADKVGINSALIKNPNLIKKFSTRFGSQCITISIQARKRGNKKWEAFYENGKEPSGKDVVEWSKEVELLGAGEILLTSIDCDGTLEGLDFDLINQVSNNVSIPVISSGGASNEENILNAFNKTRTSAIAVGSALHYNKINFKKLKSNNEIKW